MKVKHCGQCENRTYFYEKYKSERCPFCGWWGETQIDKSKTTCQLHNASKSIANWAKWKREGMDYSDLEKSDRHYKKLYSTKNNEIVEEEKPEVVEENNNRWNLLEI